MSQFDQNQQPQQPGWGQPGYQAPQQPPKSGNWFGRHKVLTVLGSIVALIVVIAIASSGGSDKKSDTAKDAPAAVASKAPAKKTDKAPAAKPKAKAKPVEEKKPAAKSYGDGDYKVGTDIPAGTYESAGASDSVIPLCAITTAPTGSATMPQAKAANKANQRIIITLKPSDGVVTVQGCKPLKARQ